MSDSTIGESFKVTTFGESHGLACGAIIDGCPAMLPLSEDIIYSYLKKRRPGQNLCQTSRNEKDKPIILSGVYNGLSLGTPIAVMVENKDQRSKDYSALKDVFRPGHADYTYSEKYSHRDHRGGGRSSGRETIGRVIGGAIAMEVLKTKGIQIEACTSKIGEISSSKKYLRSTDIIRENKDNDLVFPDKDEYIKAKEYLLNCCHDLDSTGSEVFCRISGLPKTLGRPVFSKLEARLAYALMSIGGVKGVSFGEGFNASKSTGSKSNDPFTFNSGSVMPLTNNAGGTLGGISTGMDVTINIAFKPTPSIAKPQQSVDKYGNDISLSIKGRHDPIISPRAVPVCESMAAIIILDEIKLNAYPNMPKFNL